MIFQSRTTLLGSQCQIRSEGSYHKMESKKEIDERGPEKFDYKCKCECQSLLDFYDFISNRDSSLHRDGGVEWVGQWVGERIWW